MQQYGFILAGTGSGCGKTTISLGLMALLKDQGMTVAPFKTGPDYIDPLFHSHVVGKPSYNLDTFMLPHQTAKHLFYEHSKGADIAVVEGVMGMYDGMGPEARGSTHELSTVLGLPIILVVDCKGLYQSVSAVVKGFMSLMPTANIKGVILNHVYGGGHFEFLDQLVQRDCGVPCVGYLPPDKR